MIGCPTGARATRSSRWRILEPPTTLVYRSLRERSRGHRWPLTEPPPADTLALTWALVATDVPAGVRLHLRLRARTTRAWTVAPARVVGGAFDALTVGWLFAGLRERLTPEGPRPAPR